MATIGGAGNIELVFGGSCATDTTPSFPFPFFFLSFLFFFLPR